MTVSQFQSGKRQRTRRGVSLIEVLVVLVILVVGILTIIRLFPSGFFSIQSTGNAALANSLGGAAINLGEQNAQSLPEAILPGSLNALGLPTGLSTDAAYDPDNPNLLDNARVITNETISVPTVSRGKSVYVVQYGPVTLGIDPSTGTDATSTILTMLPQYLSVTGLNWTPLDGNPSLEATPPADPQGTLAAASPHSFLVDLKNQRIAIPYAPYTLTDSTTTPPTSTSYDQRMLVTIVGSDKNTYTQYLDVPPGTPHDSTNILAPQDSTKPPGTYLPDTATNYQGGWFDPTGVASTVNYPDPNVGSPQQTLPTGVTWAKVTMYPIFTGIANTKPFGLNPYQFQIINANIDNAVHGANVGAIAFNPTIAHGTGAEAVKARLSYMTSSWKILREDHDVPALAGSGSTFVVRTTVPNLLLAGSANPDNTINSGIAGSSSSIIILNLDTGQLVAPFSQPFDPTTPDKPINNEDLNGTMSDPSLINVSYSLGRLTFGSDAFGDNSSPTPASTPGTDGAGTAPAHRIRIFYTADLNWTVAVQKAPAYFRESVTMPTAGTATGTTPLAADQFAYDSVDAFVYFPHCNAGKTVEIDGTYTTSGATPVTQGFSDTIAVSQVLSSVGDSNVSVNLNDPKSFEYPVPAGATVVFSAVRGLSARSVVAWKERNVYKVHSVDTILNRTP